MGLRQTRKVVYRGKWILKVDNPWLTVCKYNFMQSQLSVDAVLLRISYKLHLFDPAVEVALLFELINELLEPLDH